MRYQHTLKTFTVEFRETISTPLDREDEEITEILININLQRHNKLGMSKELLTNIVNKATEKLSSYRIFHTSEGLTITGRL
jgi:stress response protein SCP2